MAKVDIWMPVYIGDYLRDTEELTGPEHGAYLLLLMHYWQKNGEIGSDVERLARVCKSSVETCSFILGYYFVLENGNYKNKRADEEIAKAEKRRVSRSENGKMGGRPPKNPVNKPIDNLQLSDRLFKTEAKKSSSSSSSPIPTQEKKEIQKEILHAEPLIPETPILPESSLSGAGRIEKARSLWNSHAPTIGPACRLLSIQFRPEDTSDCLRTMSGYTDEEIAEAMGNYEKILASPGHEVKSRYQSFVGFIRGGVEKFVSEADPWTAYKRRLSFAEQDEADTKRALAEVFERNQEAEG